MALPPDPSSGVDKQPASAVGPDTTGHPLYASPSGRSRTIHWHSLGTATLFTLVIAGPTLWWEEAWRGRPMIDQTGDLWVLPTVIVALAFFLGGAIAGRHRRRPAGALVQGVALALPTSVLLVVVDIARRSALHRGQSVGVAELWLAAIGGTVGIAALGALFGRWLYRLHEDRKSLVRHV